MYGHLLIRLTMCSQRHMYVNIYKCMYVHFLGLQDMCSTTDQSMYVCTHVCVYACMGTALICMYICMYLCVYGTLVIYLTTGSSRPPYVCMHMCVYTYVRYAYVCMYICVYANVRYTYVCIFLCLTCAGIEFLYVRMYVCMHACKKKFSTFSNVILGRTCIHPVCMYVCIYVHIHLCQCHSRQNLYTSCMYVCMYVCMYIYIFASICRICCNTTIASFCLTQTHAHTLTYIRTSMYTTQLSVCHNTCAL